jgi:hypothetical protein
MHVMMKQKNEKDHNWCAGYQQQNQFVGKEEVKFNLLINLEASDW